ncbi:MAG: phosphatase, partial [Hamadaea sp.]|nr:phosphatase [Hamadaea sp.]
MTCFYRCGNACDHPAPNDSGNAYFGDLASSEVSRRGVLQAAGAGAVVLGLAGAGVAGTATPAAASGTTTDTAELAGWRPGHGPQPLTFAPVAPNSTDALTLADGYAHSVEISWV